MRCPHCQWPVDEMTRLSTHLTSAGWVSYRRCICGAVSVHPVVIGDDLPRTRVARASRTGAARPLGRPTGRWAVAGLPG